MSLFSRKPEAPKEFTSRGGAVSVTLTDAWIQEPEDTGVMLYRKRQDSGTLRINVLTFGTPEGPTEEIECNGLSAVSERQGVEVTRHSSGGSMVRYVLEFDEEGEMVRQVCWQIARVTAPRELEVVVASYTVEVTGLADPVNVADLERAETAIAGLHWNIR